MDYNNNLNFNDSSYIEDHQLDENFFNNIFDNNSNENLSLNEEDSSVYNNILNEEISKPKKIEVEILNKKRNRDEINSNLNIINKLNNTNYDEITYKDLNEILTISFKSLDLGPIIRDENGCFKKCLTFCKTKSFQYICSKTNTLKQKFFKGKFLIKRNETQIKLFNNINAALINAKYAYYNLNEHGLVNVKTGTITNLKARKIMEEVRVELYILLKKLCVSLKTHIEPLYVNII